MSALFVPAVPPVPVVPYALAQSDPKIAGLIHDAIVAGVVGDLGRVLAFGTQWASTVVAGDAFQLIPLTSAYAASGPATYYVLAQLKNIFSHGGHKRLAGLQGD